VKTIGIVDVAPFAARDVAVGEDEVHRRLRELLRRRRQGDDVASREADVEAHVALLKSELFEPRP